MPVYKVTNPETGKVFKFKGDSPPDEATIEQAFASYSAPDDQITPQPSAIPIDQSLPQKAEDSPGILAEIKDAFTGELRTTPEVEAMPGVGEIPELNDLTSLNSFKSALGSLMAGPEETVQIIQANYPEVGVRQDEKGNYILTSSIDGKDYAIQPGFRVADIPKVAGAIAAFTPAGGARTLLGQILGGAATQAGVEATQAATGGDIDPAEIALAGATSGITDLASKGVKAGLRSIRGGAPEEAIGVSADAVRSADEATRAMSLEELGETARKTGSRIGSQSAKEQLAQQAAPDLEAIEAAKRLGIDDYLQPDHVSTSQSFRELAQAVKSFPGSKTRQSEVEGLTEVAKRADELIEEIGGTSDLSTLDKTVRTRLDQVQGDLQESGDRLYRQLREKIPAKTPVQANNILSFIEGRADDLGGIQYLTPMEKKIFQSLSDERKPTYARLDDIRKALTAARVKKEGAFKDQQTGLIKKLENELKLDQKVVADAFGAEDIFNNAQRTVAIRKGVEDDIKSLYGRNLNGTILKDLDTSVKNLSKGDVSKFIDFTKKIPKEMRQEVVASGLESAFGKTAKSGNLSFANYSDWFKKLERNNQAYNALMANLPKEARQSLKDLAKVSEGIRKASRESIKTGRLAEVRNALDNGDSSMKGIYDLAMRAAGGAIAGTQFGSATMGTLLALGSALSRNKPSVLQIADDVIVSPEFARMAANPSERTINAFKNSPSFKKFWSKVKSTDSSLSTPEVFISGLIQSARQQDN